MLFCSEGICDYLLNQRHLRSIVPIVLFIFSLPALLSETGFSGLGDEQDFLGYSILQTMNL